MFTFPPADVEEGRSSGRNHLFYGEKDIYFIMSDFNTMTHPLRFHILLEAEDVHSLFFLTCDTLCVALHSLAVPSLRHATTGLLALVFQAVHSVLYATSEDSSEATFIRKPKAVIIKG
jgi:hypothetical protein